MEGLHGTEDKPPPGGFARAPEPRTLGRMRPCALVPLIFACACSAAPPVEPSARVTPPIATASAPAPASSTTAPVGTTAVSETPKAWKAPPPPDALLSELADATRARRDEILRELATRHGGAALVAALSPVGDGSLESRWLWQRRVFDAIDLCADPRAAEALVAYGAKLGPVESKAPQAALEAERSLRAYGRTRVALALAELGDLRALPGLVERLGLDPTSSFAPERFWESDAGGHLSKTDILRVASARMLSELFDANPGAPASTWTDAERAVLAWVEQKPMPHSHAMRFLARVRSDRGLRALRKWAFPPDALPKVGAQPPFPTAFETAQSALFHLGAADPASAPRLVAQLTRKPADFDGSQEALMNAGVGMRGMAFRALGYGAAGGLALTHDPSSIDALWKVARDPKTHEEVREMAAEALGKMGDVASLERALTEAVTHSAGRTPEDGVVTTLMFDALAEAAHPKLAAGLLALLERTPSGSEATAASLALSLTPLEPADEARLVSLLGHAPARAEVLQAALWATGADMKIIVAERAKLGDAERLKLDDLLFRTTNALLRGPGTPQRIARFAVRARAFTEKGGSDKVESALRAGLENTPLSGPEWSRSGLRRALLSLARRGDRGAVLALASWPEPGPLLALASGDGGVPDAVVQAARAELAAHNL